MRVVYAFFIAVLTVACGSQSDDALVEKYSKVYKTEIAKIDGLQSDLATTVDAFNEIDSTKAESLFKNYSYATKVLHKYYDADSVDETFARRFTMYKGLKKTQGYSIMHKRYLDEATKTNTQLKNLKNDLQHGIVKEDKVKEYLELETKGANTIISALDSYTQIFKNYINIYDTLNPHVLIVVDSLLELHKSD